MEIENVASTGSATEKLKAEGAVTELVEVPNPRIV